MTGHLSEEGFHWKMARPVNRWPPVAWLIAAVLLIALQQSANCQDFTSLCECRPGSLACGMYPNHSCRILPTCTSTIYFNTSIVLTWQGLKISNPSQFLLLVLPLLYPYSAVQLQLMKSGILFLYSNHLGVYQQPYSSHCLWYSKAEHACKING